MERAIVSDPVPGSYPSCDTLARGIPVLLLSVLVLNQISVRVDLADFTQV